MATYTAEEVKPTGELGEKWLVSSSDCFFGICFLFCICQAQPKISTNSVTAIPYRWAWGEMAWDWGKEELQAVKFTQDSLTKFHYVYLAGFWHRSTRFISSLNTCIDELVAVCPYMLKVWYKYIILKTNWVRIGYWQKLQVWVGYRVLIGHRLYRNE